MGRSVLVVEDDGTQRNLVASMLRGTDLDSEIVADAEAALSSLALRHFDAILSDVRMPGRSGIELVREARRLKPKTPVVLMTGFASVDAVVESMRAGAFDFIEKPFRRKDLLRVLSRALGPPGRATRVQPGTVTGEPVIVGSSGAMRDIRRLATKIADHRANVLVTGESGTGKELVARLIHARSGRAGAPFVAVNCAAIPEALLESELFGYERGAFTGADMTKPGLLEVADGGTCLLDEIGDMALGLQSKLLRAIEDREIRRLGGRDVIRVDVRFVAATHRDLREAVAAGEFRRDLYFRLGVIPIHIPPLRARRADVHELALHFLGVKAEGRPMRFGDGVLERLAEHVWEGNVRELENAIERAVALADADELRESDFELLAPCAGSELDAGSYVQALVETGWTLRELEDQVIAETLRVTGGNMVEASRRLGISRRTLYRRREADAECDGREDAGEDA